MRSRAHLMYDEAKEAINMARQMRERLTPLLEGECPSAAATL